MAVRNRVRGVRTPIPAGYIIGRGAGRGTGNAELIPVTQLLQGAAAAGLIPAGGGSLPSISNLDILANISGSTALPIGNTLTAILDAVLGTGEGSIIQRGASTWGVLTHGSANQVLQSGGASALNSWEGLSALLDSVFGNTEGNLLQRGSSAWQVLAPGTVNYVLTSGGASALNSWQAPAGGVSFTNKGTWGGLNAYNEGDVTQYHGSSYLCYSAVTAPAGGIALDGSASSYANSSAPTVTLTTTDSNDIIIVVVQAVSFSASPSVSSIGDVAGLTWTKRKQFQYTPSFPGSNGYSDTEIWWAKAASPLSADVITVNMAATDNVALTAFGLNGAASLTSPFDSNVSLPATNSNSGPGAPSVTGVSTSIGTGDGFVFFTMMSSEHGTGWTPGLVTGYTDIATPHGGSVDGGVCYQHIGTNLSSQTITSNDTDYYWSAAADCVDGGAVPNTSPDMDDSHWVSQGAINTVDANFAITAGELSLATIVSGDVIANSGASTAEPAATTLTALIDRAIASTQGDILYRGASAWSALATGTAGQVLKTGGASANPSWITQFLTSVDANFSVTSNQLALAAIASGDVLGNSGGSSAEPAATTLTALIDQAIASTQGDILYRGASAWSALATGTAGQVLKTGGSSANPSWITQFLTSVDSNFSVTSNQLALASIASGDVLGNSGSSSAEPSAATLTAMLDRAFGSTEGQILQRGSSSWQVLAPASHAGELLVAGGSSALNAWGSALSFNTSPAAGNESVTSAYPTFVMMGLKCSYTPVKTGSLFFSLQGALGGSVASSEPIVVMAYGTGTAPSNGAAAAGTTVGPIAAGINAVANDLTQQNFSAVVTGLTVGTAYWFDLQGCISGTGTCVFNNGLLTVLEL